MLRDGTAFGECCAAVIGETVDDDAEGSAESRGFGWEKSFINHHKAEHSRSHSDEVVLSRLWMMQEILLSDHIQFVQCDTGPLNLRGYPSEYGRKWASISLRENLKILASSWSLMWRDASATTESKLQDVRNFLLTFLTYGTVSRGRAQNLSSFSVLGVGCSVWLDTNSLHRATKCRDYILAVMPRFEFYKVPNGVRQMSFGELFANCFLQLEAETSRIKYPGTLEPLIPAPFETGLTTPRPSINIPEPRCLGDFAKLLSGPKLSLQVLDSATGSVGYILYEAQISRITWYNITDMLSAVVHCISIVKQFWYDAFVGELGEAISNSTFQDYEPHGWGKHLQAAYDIARFIMMKIEASVPLLEIPNQLFDDERCRTLLETYSDSPSSLEKLVRILAMVPCNLGLGALDWSEENLEVVSVKFHDIPFLALVPKQFAEQEEYEYFIVRAEGYFDSMFESCNGVRLLALKRSDPLCGCVCLAPPVLSVDEWGPGDVHYSVDE